VSTGVADCDIQSMINALPAMMTSTWAYIHAIASFLFGRYPDRVTNQRSLAYAKLASRRSVSVQLTAFSLNAAHLITVAVVFCAPSLEMTK
jgi:hypothetical protein